MYDKWDPKKAVGFVEARFDEGDKAALKGHLQEAILGWVAAVHVIRGSLWGYGLSEPEVMVVGGRFCGLWARRYVSLIIPSCMDFLPLGKVSIEC